MAFLLLTLIFAFYSVEPSLGKDSQSYDVEARFDAVLDQMKNMQMEIDALKNEKLNKKGK